MNDMNYDRRADGYTPVKVQRIFDSCSDKDCLSDLLVTLNEGTLPPEITIVRSRAASVENVCVNVEPIPFNRGFYSIDLTFTFSIEILGYERACSAPVTFFGTAYASKNCILYGSESSVKTFVSGDNNAETPPMDELPTASISVLEPVVLETKICRSCPCMSDPVPTEQRDIHVTLGLFSVAELSRPVTMLVRTRDYTIPKKECCTDADSPCEVFGKLKFPEEEFSPTALLENCECEELDEAIS